MLRETILMMQSLSPRGCYYYLHSYTGKYCCWRRQPLSLPTSLMSSAFILTGTAYSFPAGQITLPMKPSLGLVNWNCLKTFVILILLRFCNQLIVIFSLPQLCGTSQNSHLDSGIWHCILVLGSGPAETSQAICICCSPSSVAPWHGCTWKTQVYNLVRPCSRASGHLRLAFSTLFTTDTVFLSCCQSSMNFHALWKTVF